jgi:acyl carrier protein
MDIEILKQELKIMVVEECDANFSAESIGDDEQLIGSEGRLGLDSLDALTLSLAVKDRYHRHIDSGNETRKALSSINHLAAFIIGE